MIIYFILIPSEERKTVIKFKQYIL